MDFWTLILNVVLLLTIALLLGLLLERFKQSAILGYLAAGVVMGPGALNLISGRDAIAAMAELGVALLLFTIGLEFSYSRFKKMGAIAIGGGTLQIVLTGLVVAGIALAFGFSLTVALALGVIVAPSSTACVLRILTSRAEIDSVYGRNSLGILLLQDIALVPLVLIVSLLGGEGTLGEILWEVGRALALAVLVVVLLYVIINHVLSRVLNLAFGTRNRELPVLLAATTCLGSAWVAHAFGLSPAIGAFGAGLLLAESPFATQIRSDIGGLRALFMALFFVSIGMLANVRVPIDEWALRLLIVGLMIFGKALIIWPIGRLFRHSHRNALATGICLAQVGEFSFVLGEVGVSMGIIDAEIFRFLITSAVITLFLSPLLIDAAPRIGTWTEKKLMGLGIARAIDKPLTEAESNMEGHAIVVGIGPSGKGALEALNQKCIPVIAVDLNPRAISLARCEGIQAEVGDASHAEVLEHVNVSQACAVIVTVPEHNAALQIVRQIKALAPKTPIIARARYNAYAKELELAGAHAVIDEEKQVGRSLGIEIMQHIEPAC
jgi:CPA2 family monovalent cation:H+ antiporter-2